MMEDISKAIELAIAAFKEKFGEDAKLEEGDEVVFQLNNCVLIISIMFLLIWRETLKKLERNR